MVYVGPFRLGGVLDPLDAEGRAGAAGAALAGLVVEPLVVGSVGVPLEDEGRRRGLRRALFGGRKPRGWEDRTGKGQEKNRKRKGEKKREKRRRRTLSIGFVSIVGIMFSSSARRLGSLAKRHGLKAAAAVGAAALGATAVCEPIEQKLVARLEASSTHLTSS